MSCDEICIEVIMIVQAFPDVTVNVCRHTSKQSARVRKTFYDLGGRSCLMSEQKETNGKELPNRPFSE